MNEQADQETAFNDPPKEKKLSGAQRKKDNRKRVKNPKTGVWELENKWQPHARVLRGRQNT